MRLRTRTIGILIAVLAGTATLGAATGASAQDVGVSQNWAGYVAGGNNFSSVAASWVEPSVNCTSGRSYSAYWVGLGGASGQSDALEQTGTQADCNGDGTPYYYAWYEIVPAAPVTLGLNVSAGDRISARVSVNGSAVTFLLTDDTTGAAASRTVQASNVDTSTAEWIAEAPSACDQNSNCQPLPLADFGTVNFTGATATADGHTGPISDPNWNAQAVVLSPGSNGGLGDVAYQPSGGAAQPTDLSADGESFSVTTSQDNGSTTQDPSAGNGSGWGGGSGSGWGDGSGSGSGWGGGSASGWGGGSASGWGGGYVYLF